MGDEVQTPHGLALGSLLLQRLTDRLKRAKGWSQLCCREVGGIEKLSDPSTTGITEHQGIACAIESDGRHHPDESKP
ncbi:hypothetical protein [Synechococcus sp. MIT S1220]|uniref:hypothetical protein n=1 Tax=Synechococcus sp. MIT S1220 TaxID=3082549 RepID=UPI0039AFDCF1